MVSNRAQASESMEREDGEVDAALHWCAGRELLSDETFRWLQAGT
jgi:hypothetical protein